MIKTGMVLKIENNAAFILTESGEFVKVIIGKTPPEIGETYTGKAAKSTGISRRIIAAMVAFIVLISGITSFGYYTEAAAIEVDMIPSVKIKINHFNKVIKAIPLNEKGKSLLESIKIKNKNTDEALTLLFETAKKSDFITDADSNKAVISIKILSKLPKKKISTNEFESYLDKNKINTTIYKEDKENNKETISSPSQNGENKSNSSNGVNSSSDKDKEKTEGYKENSKKNGSSPDKDRGSSGNNNNNNNNNNNSKNKNNKKEKGVNPNSPDASINTPGNNPSSENKNNDKNNPAGSKNNPK